ncbi:LruC domain-containing protein [Desertivirga brevis]|uniref:LruC domain-containing protein n=1 Tax=Desertivirga brevis TaxID=2810310 RepID=UPI001A966ADA|nr:LruC domain-containing protein [Pedobacter sp. SYSU D00873]
MNKTLLAIPILAIALLSSCKKNESESASEENGGVDFATMAVPDKFSYATSETQPLSAEVLLLGKTPYAGAQFEVYLEDPTASLDDPAVLDSIQMVSSFTLNNNGQYNSEIKVPTYVEKIYLLSKSLGIPEVFEIDRTSAGFKLQYSADAAVAKNRTLSGVKLSNKVMSTTGGGASTSAVARTWNSVGYPNYLIDPYYVSGMFVRRFQTAVPYKTKVNPALLNTSIPRNIVLDLKPGQTADISISFMFATSTYRNTLGYYWYDSNNPPASPAAIVNKGYVFPSTSRSAVSSYSGLVAGQTVKLQGPNADGSFNPGTTVGFFIIANGFIPSTDINTPGTIRTARTTYYSDKRFNAAGTSGNMNGITERMVVLYDQTTNKIVWAIEDGTDADYSDVAFFASWTPNEAIPTGNYPKLPDVPRTDKDYVFFPGKNLKGTLLYEDCWPRLGDFDMNDLVINHNYTGYLDETGKVTDISFSFDLKALSAQLNNSFGVMVPGVSPNNVQVVNSYNLDNVNSNTDKSRTYAIESGHTNDVVVKVFTAASTIMGGNVVNNTGDGAITRPVEKFSFTVRFKTPISVADFNKISPFIITNDRRNVETHLPNRRPTIKANAGRFGTEDDGSSTTGNKFYLSNGTRAAANLTWAVEVPSEIPYTKSGRSMTRAFLKFSDWVTSGGVNSTNWYTGATGNRAGSLLVYP